MGRRGWAGAPPSDDREARERIVLAAVTSVERRGPHRTTLSAVAADLGITRPTVYRLFPSTEDLLTAAAEVALDGWTARIGLLANDFDDPVDFLVESVAHLVEQLPGEPLLTVLLKTDRMLAVTQQMVTPGAVARSRVMLENTGISWAAVGLVGSRMDDFIEFVLRIIQSMVIAPSDPPREAEALRSYLRQWIGPAVSSTSINTSLR